MNDTSTNTNTKVTTHAELMPLTEETVAALMQVTQDPIDGMRLASDIYAMCAYAAEQRLAEQTGATSHRLPKPTSKFLRGFIAHLKSWVETMAESLRPDEIERLKRIGTSLAPRLNDEPGLILEEVFTVVTMAPVFAVGWLRRHLDEIEAKVAS